MGDEGLRTKCGISEDIYDYIYVSQGKTKVESIDDNEELEYTEDAFNVLGFSDAEKFSCYMLTAGVMSSGGIEYKTKGRDDQAECEHIGRDTFPGKAAIAFQIDAFQMIKAFCKPRIKVGTEWVIKGQTCEQSTNATAGIARAIYDRLFKWLIEKCNDTLTDCSLKKADFCAVLDIAGFEIFEYNGFEQISINFVNEKLQQFFNHHMFVVEQEEYVKEGIDWVMVDFGMDLAAAIIMFEKPMGIWAILEEESLFPKATDKSFEEKLKASLGKLPVFLKPQSKTDKNTRADEAEVNALKGGRKAMIKMETRIRELESELDAETRRFGDVTKNLRKSERSIKELTFAADEDRKNHERMQALIDQLQGKVKSYKKQIEEAEEIAALNLAKYRKVAGALGDAEASADANEQAMAMRKARAKSASLGL